MPRCLTDSRRLRGDEFSPHGTKPPAQTSWSSQKIDPYLYE